MPSISTIFSPTLSAQWREYFSLLNSLRGSAIWRHEEDGESRPNGGQRPPRFVAVVDDAAHFARFQAQAEALADLNTKWPVQCFDEVWGWGRVSVGSGSRSQRLEAGLPADIGEVSTKELDKVAGVIAILEASGHWAAVADGRLMVTPGPAGLTARLGSGRAFRLAAWSESGEQLHSKLSVGVVVCRGVLRGIEDTTGRPRKQRADALPKLTNWAGVNLYQP
ncbi:hypothetical protein GCM10017783_26130 [Deinococcus piscis]|uniref:Uncharacterized protein n=1 Tax=Deinococcus piscis TaxID=394230 RepID=A0ABQ3KES0_9DEIO|nr:hypothetical protein [Deinococcus piscis]GHG13094.1 hypothetical protein GCM10017783_26130 [Deinococcus piscis]